MLVAAARMHLKKLSYQRRDYLAYLGWLVYGKKTA